MLIIQKSVLGNICIIHLKNKEFKDVVKYADDALEVDHKFEKVLFLKGKALLEMTEYEKAIEVLKVLVEWYPENEEARKEFERAESSFKKYKEKETKMFQKMFS